VTQISQNLLDVQDYLSDSWSGIPKVRHSILCVSRGPKGSMKAIAIGADDVGGGSDIDGACIEDNSLIVNSDTFDLDRI
jgi:hypothetical protein